MLTGYSPIYDDNPFGIYQQIMDGYYKLPPLVEPKARELVKSFLCADRSSLLGNQSDGGNEVKANKWFNRVYWKMVNERGMPPP